MIAKGIPSPPPGLGAAPLQVLLVEDEPADAALFQELVQGDRGTSGLPQMILRVEWVRTLRQALTALASRTFHVVALDLNLEDSDSLETFQALRRLDQETAVVVLTGLADQTLGLEAIRQGAQDYLVKGRWDGELLTRSLFYAAERQRLLNELETLRQRRRQEQEIHSLEDLANTTENDSRRVYALTDHYAGLVRQYVLAARERQARPTEGVRLLAARLVAMGATARDVVRLHLWMLRQTGTWSTPAEERAYSQDARLVLVELLGNLADLYHERASTHGKTP